MFKLPISPGMPPGPPMMPMQQMRPPQGFPPMPPRPPVPPLPSQSDDEPPNKRQKTEEQLVPEEDWLRTHKVGALLFVNLFLHVDKYLMWLNTQSWWFTACKSTSPC